MLLAINISFVLASLYLGDILGYLFCFIVLTIAASESAVGLSFLIIYRFHLLKWVHFNYN